MIKLTDHKIDSSSSDRISSFDDTPNHSGIFPRGLPDTIVIHYTAGDSYSSSVNWLKNKDAKASAHLVIGRKGEIVQLLPFNRIAWHAGTSQWKNRKGLNKYSIGIELANAGILTKRPSAYYSTFGKKIDDENVIIARHKHGSAELAWESYTTEQLEAVEEICLALVKQYNISEILGHDDIAQGRKTDPGSAFPMKSLRDKILLGRKDEPREEPESTDAENLKGIVLADRLNIRNAPNRNAPTVADPLQKGTKFNILKIEGQWAKVKIETEGWVSRQYIKYFE